MPVEVPLVAANRSVFKVVVLAQLVLNEVEAEDAVLELVGLVNIGTLVAAASQDGVHDKDGKARDDEQRVLQ